MLLGVSAAHAQLRSDPFNPIPAVPWAQTGPGLIRTWQLYEDASTRGRMFGNFVYSGGTHATSASLTSAAFATEAFVPERVLQSSTAITYPALAADICYTLISSDTDGITGWTRVGTTAYYVLCQGNTTALPQPTTPPNSIMLMRVDVTGSALATVTSLKATSPIIAAVQVGGSLPTPSPTNKGQLIYQTNSGTGVGGRGLKVSDGNTWHTLGAWNVLDWGLIPNLTDAATIASNISALQAAINAAILYCTAQGCGVGLYVPGGSYYFGTGTVTIPAGSIATVCLFGDGPYASQLRKAAGATGPLLTIRSTAKPTCVMNLGIIGPGDGLSDGIDVVSANGVFLENLWLAVWFDGISTNNSSSIYIDNVTSEEHARNGYSLDGGDIHVANARAFSVSQGFLWSQSGSGGIPATPTSANSCVGCSVWEGRNECFMMDTVGYLTISGATCAQTKTGTSSTKGVYVKNSNHITVTGSFFGNLLEHGILVDGSSQATTITGNDIVNVGTGATGIGIEMGPSIIGAIISGNHITTTRRSCIKNSEGSEVMITGNNTNDCAVNATAGDANVLLSGTAGFKTVHVNNNYFGTSPGVAFVAGTTGTFYLNDNHLALASGTLYDMTNAPATMQRPVIFKNSKSAVLNFGVPGAVPGIVTANITVEGAALGDVVKCGAPLDAGNNYIFGCKVNSANLVTLYYYQLLGAAADPDAGGGTYTAEVTRYAY